VKHHLLQLSITALVGAPAVAGCGGDDGGDDDDFARFSARDVQARFQALTGYELEASDTGLGNVVLTLASRVGPDEEIARRRFGSFQITVSEDEDALERRQEVSSSGQALRVDNVLLRGGYGSGENATFRRLAAIVRSLGRPLSAVRLPAADTPCARQGIDPDGGDGKAGTCLEGGQTVTVVPTDAPLVLPERTVSRPVTTLSRTVTTRRYGTARTLRARGQFVLVRTRVENTSNAPLQALDAELVINGRRYAAYEQDYLLQDRGPLQPGERTSASFLFDIPRSAEDPRTGGALQFAATPQGSGLADRDVAVGRIRLG
jgi:hypothetical protein